MDSLDKFSSAYPIGLGHNRLPGSLGQDTWLYIRLSSLQAWYLGIASFEFVFIVLLVLLAFRAHSSNSL